MRFKPRPAHRRNAILAAVAVVLAAIGVTFLVVGLRAQKHAPQPPASAAGTYADSAPATGTPSGTSAPASTPTSPLAGVLEPQGLVLAKSTPTHLSIPAIGVSSSLIRLGLNPDHTVQVPPLGADSKAGWYRYSPAPGQLGPAILLGHIDSAAYGPGVFYKLGALRKGDTVSVRRADNQIAVFRVDAVAEYPKNRFPTLTVYGNTDRAALRLITCGGKFDFSAHSYEDNIVAFATLVSAHRA